MSHAKVLVIGFASARIEGWCTYCVRRAWAHTTEAMPFPRKIESQDHQAQAISVDWFIQQLSLRAQWGGHCYHTEYLLQGNMRFTMTYGAKLKSNKRKFHLDIQSTLVDSAELKFDVLRSFDQHTSPVQFIDTSFNHKMSDSWPFSRNLFDSGRSHQNIAFIFFFNQKDKKISKSYSFSNAISHSVHSNHLARQFATICRIVHVLQEIIILLVGFDKHAYHT